MFYLHGNNDSSLLLFRHFFEKHLIQPDCPTPTVNRHHCNSDGGGDGLLLSFLLYYFFFLFDTSYFFYYLFLSVKIKKNLQSLIWEDIKKMNGRIKPNLQKWLKIRANLYIQVPQLLFSYINNKLKMSISYVNTFK